MTKTLNSLLLFFVVVLFSCGSGPGYTVRKLPSGKEIKIISVGKVFLTGDSPALWLNYRTELDIDNLPSLRKEADEIWMYFMVDAEKSGLTNAVISAHSDPVGTVVKRDTSYNFVFQKSKDGTWKRI